MWTFFWLVEESASSLEYVFFQFYSFAASQDVSCYLTTDYPAYVRGPFLKLLRNLKFTLIGFDPTPTYLSHLIDYVYIFTFSVCVFKMFLSVFFSYEIEKVKYI